MILASAKGDILQSMATEERHRYLRIMYDLIARPTITIPNNQNNEAKKIMIIPDDNPCLSEISCICARIK